MRRTIATILLAAFSLLAITFAGLSVFGMHDAAAMSTDTCAGMHCEAMPMTDMPAGQAGTGANDVRCINDCLSAVTAIINAVLPMPLAFGFLALLFSTLLSEAVTLAQPAVRRALRWREGIGIALKRQILATVILRN